MDVGDSISQVSKDFIQAADSDSDIDSDSGVYLDSGGYKVYDTDLDSDHPGVYKVYDSGSDSDTEDEWEEPDTVRSVQVLAHRGAKAADTTRKSK